MNEKWPDHYTIENLTNAQKHEEMNYEWMNEWMNEWMDEWMNDEWVN